MSKININGNQYKDKLLVQTPAENLPKVFGGTASALVNVP